MYYITTILAFLLLPIFESGACNEPTNGEHQKNNIYIDKSVQGVDLILNSLQSADLQNDVYHLFTHGRPGALFIEGSWIAQDELINWIGSKKRLYKFKKINIYGCSFASGRVGQAMVGEIEFALNVKVSASTNITGRDGDWILEINQNNPSISIPNYTYNLQTCNENQKLFNTAADNHVTAVIVDDVFELLVCLGSISDLGNITDENTANSAEVSMTGLDCDATIAVQDTATYPAGSFAGFEVSPSGLISGSIGSTVDIVTYNNGIMQDSQRVITSLIGVNLSLLNSDGHAELGIYTTAPFDEIRIIYNSIVAVLFENDIHCAFVKEFCTGPEIAFENVYVWSNPIHPVSINADETGIDGVVCGSCSVDDGLNLLSPDTADYATIHLGIGVAATGTVAIEDRLGIYPGGSNAGFAIRDLNNLVQTDLFASMSVCTYLDGVQQECGTGTQLLDLTLIVPIINGGSGGYHLGFETFHPFDEIRLEVSALAAIDNEIQIYSAFVDTRLTNMPEALLVDVNINSPFPTGLTWEHAFSNIEDALESDLLSDVDTIKIAQGTYAPNTVDRTDSYKFPGELVVVGGYTNNGQDRDPTGVSTVLCGDIGVSGVSNDNLYHIVEISHLVTDLYIHGVTVSCGYADGNQQLEDQGAGILCRGEAVIKNVIVSDNYSVGQCAAILVSGTGRLQVSNSLIKSDNTSNSNLIFGNDLSSTLDIDPVTTVIE